MLNEHPSLHIPGESWFLIDLMNALPLQGPLSPRQVKEAYAIITGHERWKIWKIDDDRLWSRLEALDKPRLREIVTTVFNVASEGTGKTRWGDKTPEYVREIPRLHQVLPEAQFIHITRDARDVCSSLKKLEWRGAFLFRKAAYWATYVGAGITAGRQLPKGLYLEVSYEDLVSDPERELRKMCDFLEIPFDPRMTEFHKNADQNIAGWEKEKHIHDNTKRAPSSSDIHRWKGTMKALDVAVVEAMAGKIMDKVGQVRVFPRFVRILQVIFKPQDVFLALTLPLRQRLGFQRRQLSKRAIAQKLTTNVYVACGM